MQKRDFTIDFLRTIGILLIILAHVNPPKAIFQLRNFDVPFMVILSGYLYSKTKSKEEKPLEYLAKRVKRLVVPVWIFLTIIFMGGGILRQYPFSLKQIITSYGLWSGIGYVWIIRIYLIVALLGPWIERKLLKKNYWIKLISIYCLWEAVIRIALNMNLNNFIIQGILMNIPYIILFCYGISYKEFDRSKVKIINVVTAMLLAARILYFYFSKDMVLNLQDFKYPPRLDYIYYAIFASNILFASREKFNLLKKYSYIESLVTFIGNSTMWIYLWHIPPVIVIQLLNKKGYSINYLLSYILICFTAFITTYIQQKFIEYISDRFFQKNQSVSKNLKIMFMG